MDLKSRINMDFGVGKKRLGLLLALALTAAAWGCRNAAPPANDTGPPDPEMERRYRYGSLSGSEGFSLFGGSSDEESSPGETTGIGVNAYLWKASLDTVSFMPISSADPFGGTILTDWYSAPAAPDERFKLDVYILDRQLRADAVRVSVFRQVKQRGVWVDAPVDPSTATQLENTILTRARELRVAAIQP